MSTAIKNELAFVPPRHTIDLSLPPKERYKALAHVYKEQLQNLTGLYDELLLDMQLPPKWLPTVNKASNFLLRKLHDPAQTEELRGIAEVAAIPLYLLVAFNVVLDLLMGCTSGGALSLEPNQPRTKARMLHFRTLDWTMDPLRKVAVQLDFVRSKSSTPSKIIASSITYVGFVGVLTGVKQGMSMSLNFRAVHNADTRWGHFRFYFHHLLVLLGRRPSIGSLLRHCLIEEAGAPTSETSSPAAVAASLESIHTTAAYIVLSDGQTTLTMEKDYATAKVRSSSTFITITNHDKERTIKKEFPTPAGEVVRSDTGRGPIGLEEFLEKSVERLECMQQKWQAKSNAVQRAASDTQKRQDADNQTAQDVYVTREELIRWLGDWPTTNEFTHYAAILDPSKGEVSYSVAYPEPLIDPKTGMDDASDV